jgi:hypothetical protein
MAMEEEQSERLPTMLLGPTTTASTGNWNLIKASRSPEGVQATKESPRTSRLRLNGSRRRPWSGSTASIHAERIDLPAEEAEQGCHLSDYLVELLNQGKQFISGRRFREFVFSNRDRAHGKFLPYWQRRSAMPD